MNPFPSRSFLLWKKLLPAALLLGGAVTTLCAYDPFIHDRTIPVIAARVNVNGDTVTAGTSRVLVSLRLGTPSRVTADGSWIYFHYVARESGRERPAALLVRFKDSRVTRLSLIDPAIARRGMPAAGQLVTAASQQP